MRTKRTCLLYFLFWKYINSLKYVLKDIFILYFCLCSFNQTYFYLFCVYHLRPETLTKPNATLKSPYFYNASILLLTFWEVYLWTFISKWKLVLFTYLILPGDIPDAFYIMSLFNNHFHCCFSMIIFTCLNLKLKLMFLSPHHPARWRFLVWFYPRLE